jgi:hypothetical protein
MEVVAHRINRLDLLKQLDRHNGAEIDIRSHGSHLYLHHDAFVEGDSFEEFIQLYAKTHKDQLLILNPKEDGLETTILRLLDQHDIRRFFFLDLPIPTVVRLARKQNERRLAVRYSSFETLESVLRFQGLVDWVWVDCFDGEVVSENDLKQLRAHFQVCLVSPELQGYAENAIDPFLRTKPQIQAVCTKFPGKWR